MVIVDDLDFMHEQSQQVFRNYIDNYKTNVHFLFACTNLYKVIESLQSRVQMIQIPSMTNVGLRKIMYTICKNENIHLHPDSEEYLIQISNGYIRQLIQFLEKIVLYDNRDEYTRDLCMKICSTISDDIFVEYFNYLYESETPNIQAASKLMLNIISNGFSVLDIIEYMYDFIKRTEILSDDKKYKCIRAISEVKKIIKESMEDDIEMIILTRKLSEK
jgi:DNA polymerase-3 subunit gamma/tau